MQMNGVRGALGLASLLLAGCATVSPNREIDAQLQQAPERLPSQPTVIAGAENLAQWWRQLEQEPLNQLVETMLRQNPDLEAARARYVRAGELIVAERAGLFPELGASGSVDRSVGSQGPSGDSTQFQALLSASWEVDLFGGTRSSIAVAQANARKSAADYSAQRASLVAAIALAYTDEKLARTRLEITEATLISQRRTAQIVAWRVEAGLASGVDREQANQLVLQTQALLPGLRSNRRTAANQVAVLAGVVPGEVDDILDSEASLPTPARLVSMTPYDILRRRPDVASAEQALAAETFRIGVSRANLYPRLQLNGSVGGTALSIGDLVDSIVGSIGVAISQTLFDGGRNRANLRAQEAQAQAALGDYRSTVLSALEEVDNGYDALTAARERLELRRGAERAADNAATYIRQQYSSGLIDFSQLLDAERSLLSARDTRAQAEADVVQSSIRLVQALGGDAPLVPAPPLPGAENA